ncbi:MAG: penicillin-binding transpeptidase domain-containing protein [Anaerolineaceae bacterium]|nr:penicillin-binding transpeptidase domain-containing protein [Anaerolineaceae bacterium]
MKATSKYLAILIILVTLLSACNQAVAPTPTTEPTATQPLPTPNIIVETGPDVEEAARGYMELWKVEDYQAMYALLSRLTKDAVTPEAFEESHRDTAKKLTLQGMDYQILSTMLNLTTSQVSYQIEYKTALFDTVSRQTIMNLILEDGAWHIQWEAGMMLPELAGGNYLELVVESPARGNIYASDSSDNYPLVSYEEVVTVTVTQGNIEDGTEGDMVALLAEIFMHTDESIREEYANVAGYQYAIIGDITAEVAEQYYDRLNAFAGIGMQSSKARFYHDGGIAPHVVGYVLNVPAENLEYYQRLGYTGDEKIGYSGLEAWGEEYLAGTHGADLYVKDLQGQVLTKIAEADAKPAQSIYTTIESQLQYWLQQSVGDNIGAIVVLERDTGRVIAMVSTPGYDPNVFVGPYYTSYSIAEVIQNPYNPMYNRAAQGVYPPGSVFKVVTMATALETGVFTKDYPYYCDSLWTELDGWVGKDWTYDRGFAPSGMLTLQEGLMRSCNPWFWHIAYTLWNDGDRYRTSLPDVAAGFGLGKPTGIEIPEFAGNINMTPADVNEYVQMAIGQSTLQNSPLQIANFIAAIGNGGTLHQPSVVERIGLPGQEPIHEFEPIEIGKLPVTPENLEAIQEAMTMVIRDPRGTANFQFQNYPWNIAGKTGTAENPLGTPHAWFAGYTYEENPDRPDIAIAIILENAGEGSEMAAPLFRRVVSLYFSNMENAGGIMPWESAPYIPAQPDEE